MSATPDPIQTCAVMATPLLERLICFLLPYFTDLLPDPEAARTEILETLASYGARTRAELLHAARIIAFSMTTLDVLHEAKTTEMSQSMRLRYCGCANNLDRSSRQNQQALDQRLAAAPPPATDQAAEPTDDMPQAEFEAALQHAHAEIATHRTRSRPVAPRSGIFPSREMSPSQQQENNRLWGKAMVNILAEMGMPVQPVSPA